MANVQILRSKQDASVNFITQAKKGFFEARYVRRGDYFIAYISSQSACNRGCGFCHLTTTGQTVGQDASQKEMVEQASMVLGHYQSIRREREEPLAPYMHFNFMARGEPLSNPNVNDGTVLALGQLAAISKLASKVNISTIMPKTLRQPLAERFLFTKPTIYYSLYSLKQEFRDKWLPGAMPYQEALAQLANYARVTGAQIKIHYAFIEGENDDPEDTWDLAQVVKSYNIPGVSFNIVRYNPPDANSRESTEEVIHRNAGVLLEDFPVQVVTRVGLDVYASCGTFFSGLSDL